MDKMCCAETEKDQVVPPSDSGLGCSSEIYPEDICQEEHGKRIRRALRSKVRREYLGHDGVLIDVNECPIAVWNFSTECFGEDAIKVSLQENVEEEECHCSRCVTFRIVLGKLGNESCSNAEHEDTSAKADN